MPGSASSKSCPRPHGLLFLVAEEQLGLHAENDVIFGVIADFHGDLGEETNNIGRLRLAPWREATVYQGADTPSSSVEAIPSRREGRPAPCWPPKARC